MKVEFRAYHQSRPKDESRIPGARARKIAGILPRVPTAPAPDAGPDTRPTWVAYYTPGTGYEDEINRLRASLEQHKCRYRITPIPNLGSWQKNTQAKALFLRGQVLAHMGREIIYTDADSVVLHRPTAFDGDVMDGIDLAYRNKGGNEVLSGTLFIRCNERTLALMDNWVAECKANRTKFDQKCLATAIAETEGLASYPLPPTYCAIFDEHPIIENPVILHNQASRKYKREIPPVAKPAIERPVFATWWTPAYKAAAAHWMDSAALFGLDTYQVEMPDAGSWRANTRLKPYALEKVRKANPGRAVVLCDADSLIVRYPEAFDGCALGDFGFYWYAPNKEILTGTTYWGPTDRATALIKAWKANLEKHKGDTCGEQAALTEAYEAMNDRLLATYLSEAYCRIFDNEFQVKDPVILQLMHSRKHDTTEGAEC
jgi:hypothetical protein